MSEENKALVRRWFAEIDKGNEHIVDELVVIDYIDHNPPLPDMAPGREGVKQANSLLRAAFPDVKHTIEEQIAEGDKVVTRITAIGKHDGDLPGAPRTGNDLEMTSITIHRIADVKLVEKWSEKDLLGFLPQIGVMPAPHDGTG